MARSPLFDAVLRAAREASWSVRRNRSPAEAVERWRAATLSRRQLLKGGAALGALAALPGVRTLTPRAAGKGNVVVVGAGIAGLTAAYRLHRAGVGVQVYEAQERVGGRMYSLRGHFADQQVAELGGELIDTGHENIRSLCKELHLQLDDLHTDPPGVAQDVWFFGGARRSEAEVVAAFSHVLPAIEAALAPIGDNTVSYNAKNGGEALDRQSIAEWLAKAGVSGWFHDLLDVAFTTEFGREIGEQSSLNFLTMIGTEAGKFEVFGESDERFHIHGGNDQAPTELARRLDGKIDTGARLVRIGERPDGSYELSFERGGSTLAVTAEHVVLAIPFTLLREVEVKVEMPEVKRLAIRELGYGTNAKLMVGFGERVWRTRHKAAGGSFSDLAYQSTWETSRKQGGKAGILTNFVGGKHGLAIADGTPAYQAEKFVADIEKVFPGAAATRGGMAEARFHWPTFPFTRGSYACYLVGQYTGIAGAEGERVRNLHFAGEHTSRDAQGYMEGGCASGEAVAVEILEDLGLSKAKKAASAG